MTEGEAVSIHELKMQCMIFIAGLAAGSLLLFTATEGLVSDFSKDHNTGYNTFAQ